MLTIENTEVFGWNAAIRGLRSPMNSWNLTDSYFTHIENPETENTAPFEFFLGDRDKELMKKLVKAGSDHAKFLRMIHVQVDVTAPLYWWKEADTYKVGTVRNSCSTMHKIHAKAFTLDDFSTEHLESYFIDSLKETIRLLNDARLSYLYEVKQTEPLVEPKSYWWQMIQLLPSSYNQKATLDLNYAVLQNMYHSRRNHKLDEWHTFCDWIENLPYFREVVLDAET